MTKILVVDDAAVDRRLAGGLLEKNCHVEVDFAENGRQGLQRVLDDPPDLVVTDLQMPEMDGLELVESIRAKRPGLPVVLMTGAGSEEIAVAALQRGAASYVPKSALSLDLAPTVMHVLAVSRAGETTERLMASLETTSFSFRLDNDASLIPPLVQLIKETLAGIGLCDETEQVQVGIALEEALSNAVYHGNLELTSEEMESLGYDLFRAEAPTVVEQRRRENPYAQRRVDVQIEVSREEAKFVVRDEGPGFDVSCLKNVDDQVASEQRQGRGVAHMRLFMDDASYNDKGNEITLLKRRKK